MMSADGEGKEIVLISNLCWSEREQIVRLTGNTTPLPAGIRNGNILVWGPEKATVEA